MCKNRNKWYIALCVAGMGMFSGVFAIDFTQALHQFQQKSMDIATIFGGKTQVSNLYTKALQLVKDKEVQSTTFAFDTLLSYYSTCPGLTDTDFVHILYHSNLSFRTAFIQIFPTSTQWPTDDLIDKSYKKFLVCKGIKTTDVVTLSDIQSINETINTLYYTYYSHNFMTTTLVQNNFGSDVFWNGSVDDSDFDILSDIHQLGQIFFDTFTQSPEILFYRLPTVSSASVSAGVASTPSSSSTMSTLGSDLSSSSSSSSSWGSTSSSFAPSSTAGGSSSAGAESTSPFDLDPELRDFVDDTSTTSDTLFPVSSLGDQCISGDISVQDPIVKSDEEELVDADTYISGIVDFITTPNLDTFVRTHLTESFHQQFPLSATESTSDTGYAQAIANTYAEQIFGDGVPGSCAASCQGLSLDEQTQCELNCSVSCVQSCEDTRTATATACKLSYAQAKNACMSLSAAKKTTCLATAVAKQTACLAENTKTTALCMSDCTCFLIAGPNGVGRKNIEDMFSIKFCKVPVQKQALRYPKKAYSIQAIFQEIADVLAGLKDSGQMVKFTKTKEFLDGAIKINFADNFAFAFMVSFKPVFPQTSASTKKQQQGQDVQDASVGILDMNVHTPEADDYNKYLVVADPITTEASKEPAFTVEQLQQNIDNMATLAQVAKPLYVSDTTLDAVVSTYEQNKHALFLQDMASFLQTNQSFWTTMMETLSDMTALSTELTRKIQDSK